MIALEKMGELYPEFLVEEDAPEGVLLDGHFAAGEMARDLSRFSSEHRNALVEAIGTDLQRWSAPASARVSSRRLAEAGAAAVVTGQQAGLAGGPLYTLVKAIGTVRWAEKIERENPELTVVPVFWIEGDDHDFEEVRTVGLLERSGDLRKISYDDGDERKISIARRSVSSEGMARLIEEMTELLGTTEFTEELVAALKEAYRDGSLVDGFARFLYTILGEKTPLVILSSHNSDLKGLATDIFERSARNAEKHHQALVERTEVLAERRFPTPIEPRPGHLFLQHEGERLPLDPEGENFRVRGTERIVTPEEIASIAAENPADLSGNVVLRPILQDAILPTIIYLGGPSEVAYQAQLRSLYAHFDLDQPVIVPRPFLILLEPKVTRALENDATTIEKLLSPDFNATAEVVDEAKMEGVVDAIERGKKGVERAWGELSALVGEIDPTLEKTLGAAAHKGAKDLENFGGRLRGALKKAHKTEIDRLERSRSLLLPGGGLQERTLSVLTYANLYGIAAVRALLEQIEPGPGRVQVIPILR